VEKKVYLADGFTGLKKLSLNYSGRNLNGEEDFMDLRRPLERALIKLV
jgi:hypothetical protein